jgi:hypothetical protein
MLILENPPYLPGFDLSFGRFVKFELSRGEGVARIGGVAKGGMAADQRSPEIIDQHDAQWARLYQPEYNHRSEQVSC